MLMNAKMNRRSFGVSLAALGISVLHGFSNSTRLALLSDLHISLDPENENRGFKPARNLQKIVADIAARELDSTVLTGDLARLEGLVGDYEALKALLQPVASKMPINVSLGNHDNRKNFLSVFGAQKRTQAVKDKQIAVMETPVVRLIFLDSLLMTNLTPGALGKAQRVWLDEYLKTSDNLPVILFFHHTTDDRDDSLFDFPRLWERIRTERKVKAILFGHSHRWGVTQQEEIHLINLPATGYNFSDDQPVGWVEATLTAEGGTFLLHAIGGDTSQDNKSISLAWRK